MENTAANRKFSEAEFHDLREVARKTLPVEEFERRYSNLKFYSIVGESRQKLQDTLETRGRGRVCLDYCCGAGEQARQLAAFAGLVVGIDISQQSLLNGLVDGAGPHLIAADAEQLPFANDTFDLILCNGVLHHLELDRAYRELSRVLKPDGSVICVEALAHNPAFALYRRLTPHLRTDWEVDHILRIRDIRRASVYFGNVDCRFFHLAAILGIPFRRSRVFARMLQALNWIDRLLMRIPIVQLMAWQVMFELRDPRKQP